MKDDDIIGVEFSLILSEVDKFNQMKEEIRSKNKSKIDNETKQSLIKQGEDQQWSNLKTCLEIDECV